MFLVCINKLRGEKGENTMENDFDNFLYNLPPIGGFHGDDFDSSSYDDHPIGGFHDDFDSDSYDDHAMGGFHDW